jgi:DNA-binding winged helix-turn-helix (wHTH) protein
MSACPHCRRFREERDEALEALRQARERGDGGRDDGEIEVALWRGFKIQPQAARVLAALWRREAGFVSRAALWEALDSEADGNLVDVILSAVRVSLRRACGGAPPIETAHRIGWRLTPAGRAVVDAVLERGGA